MKIKIICPILISVMLLIKYMKSYKVNMDCPKFFDRYFYLIHSVVFLIFAIANIIGYDYEPFYSILIFGSLIVYIILAKNKNK